MIKAQKFMSSAALCERAAWLATTQKNLVSAPCIY